MLPGSIGAKYIYGGTTRRQLKQERTEAKLMRQKRSVDEQEASASHAVLETDS